MRKIFFSTFLLFFIISCTNDDLEKNETIENLSYQGKNYFPLDSAILFASNIEFINNSFLEKSLESKTLLPKEREVKNTKRFKNTKGQDSFYIINYKEGFIILSADKRIDPILAYSNVDNFNFNEDDYPEGLEYWLNTTSEGILNIKLEESNDTIKHIWKKYSISIDNIVSNRPPPEEPDCIPYNIIKGPLTETTWGQGYYKYNLFTPNLGCGGLDGPNALTGCVATTLAQIMYKYKVPNTFNYDNMPLKIGSYDTSLLMKDIGDKVHMTYGCGENGGSWAKVEDAYNVLKNYGYPNIKMIEYKINTYQTIKNELDNERPVIVSGSNHMWIIDGYSSYINPCIGSTLLFRMNWGWDGKHDGYYSFNNFFVTGLNQTFSPNNIIYNIKP